MSDNPRTPTCCEEMNRCLADFECTLSQIYREELLQFLDSVMKRNIARSLVPFDLSKFKYKPRDDLPTNYENNMSLIQLAFPFVWLSASDEPTGLALKALDIVVAHVFKLIGLDRQPSQPAARMLDVLVTAEDFLRPQHQGCVYPACLARTAGGNRCRQRAMGQALASGRTTG